MTVSAIVEVKLEIQCSSNWGDSTTMEQITSQAKADAMGTLRRAAEKAGLGIRGEPTILSIKATQHIKPCGD